MHVCKKSDYRLNSVLNDIIKKSKKKRKEKNFVVYIKDKNFPSTICTRKHVHFQSRQYNTLQNIYIVLLHSISEAIRQKSPFYLNLQNVFV